MNRIEASLESFGNQSQSQSLGELLGIKHQSGKSKRGDTSCEQEQFPLQRLVVRVQVTGDCSVTTLEQHYRNHHDFTIDVVHTMPIPADGALTAFEIRAGEKWVRGDCRKTADARAAFESAKSQGQTAALIEQERDDIQTLQLANIASGSDIIVKITLIERLRVDAGRFEVRVPTTIATKYVPGFPEGYIGTGSSPDTDQAPDASRITPHVRLGGATPLYFELRVDGHITEAQGSVALDCDRQIPGVTVITLAPLDFDTSCDQDIVVRFWSRATDTTVRAYGNGEHVMVVVDPPATRERKQELPREAVYLLDCSGSMQGENFQIAKSALKNSLMLLAPNDTFELIAFANEHIKFAENPKSANPVNVKAAYEWIDQLHANGGTELHAPLAEILKSKPTTAQSLAEGSIRTVLLITDGAIGNDAMIFNLAHTMNTSTRLYVIGIGCAPSMAFLSRLARICGGTYLAVDLSNDSQKEIENFDAAMSGPIARGLSVDGTKLNRKVDLFMGRSSSFIIKGSLASVRVSSESGGQLGECAVLPTSMPLGALWAREEIMRLEDQCAELPEKSEEFDLQIESLGVLYQLQTRLTSFVAIDESGKIHGESMEIIQPTEEVCSMRHALLHSRSSLHYERTCQIDFSLRKRGTGQRLSDFMRSDSDSQDSHLQGSWSTLIAQLQLAIKAGDLLFKSNGSGQLIQLIRRFLLKELKSNGSSIRSVKGRLLTILAKGTSSSHDSTAKDDAKLCQDFVHAIETIGFATESANLLKLPDDLWEKVILDLAVLQKCRADHSASNVQGIIF